MIKSVKANNFKAVPYLETSTLMTSHPMGVRFSIKKPNVIVGLNGSGKSALMTALAMHTLSYFTGESSLDDHYVNSCDSDSLWKDGESWRREHEFLAGLTVKGDLSAALYYRPNHIHGNNTDHTHAMMCGYFNGAKAQARLVENKSSGQQCGALLDKVTSALTASKFHLHYQQVNWSYGTELKDVGFHALIYDRKAEILKERCASVAGSALPTILMDEPEQSLDAKSELHLWKLIEKTDPSVVQVIVATHSLYPLMHPKAFNLIEAVPGYIAEVKALL